MAFIRSVHSLLHSYESNAFLPFSCIACLHICVFLWRTFNACIDDCNRKQNRLYGSTTIACADRKAPITTARDTDSEEIIVFSVFVFVVQLKSTFFQLDSLMPSLHSNLYSLLTNNICAQRQLYNKNLAKRLFSTLCNTFQIKHFPSNPSQSTTFCTQFSLIHSYE